MNVRLALASVVLVPFAIFSTGVVIDHGYLGFLELAAREPWALQMLLDLSIALALFSSVAIRDARERGIPFWPYLVLTIALGSIGSLAYVIHRELVARRRAPSAS